MDKFRYIKEHANYDLNINEIYIGYRYNSQWISIEDRGRTSLFRQECFEIVK